MVVEKGYSSTDSDEARVSKNTFDSKSSFDLDFDFDSKYDFDDKSIDKVIEYLFNKAKNTPTIGTPKVTTS